MKNEYFNIANLLKSLYDIDVSRYDVNFLNKSFNKRMAEVHCSKAEEYCTLLEQNKNEGQIFLDSLQISYSEFFRNSLTFSVLERIILPSIILNKKKNKYKEIRVWSAACASGQESYSLAMLFEELRNAGNSNFNYRIFATDSSDSQVIEATKGQYSAEAINNLTLKRIKLWFTNHLPAGRPGADTYTIKPELKEHIDFSVFDLFSGQFSSPPGSIFGDFDLVVCANLLFYYKPEYRKIILEKTTGCLANIGYLITGETERDILMNHNYNEVFPQSAIFQKNV